MSEEWEWKKGVNILQMSREYADTCTCRQHCNDEFLEKEISIYAGLYYLLCRIVQWKSSIGNLIRCSCAPFRRDFNNIDRPPPPDSESSIQPEQQMILFSVQTSFQDECDFHYSIQSISTVNSGITVRIDIQKAWSVTVKSRLEEMIYNTWTFVDDVHRPLGF